MFKFFDISLTFAPKQVFPCHNLKFPDNFLILKKKNSPNLSPIRGNPGNGELGSALGRICEDLTKFGKTFWRIRGRQEFSKAL